MAGATRLLDLTAADLMSRDVITLSGPMSLRAAAHRLAMAGISGAPVVDDTGRCIGVLSATDLVRWLDRGPSPSACPAVGSGFSTEWAAEAEDRPPDDVEHAMTPNVILATPETPVGELARAMLEAHVHRIVVVGEGGRPVGVVSSMDVLAAVATEDDRERTAPEPW